MFQCMLNASKRRRVVGGDSARGFKLSALMLYVTRSNGDVPGLGESPSAFVVIVRDIVSDSSHCGREGRISRASNSPAPPLAIVSSRRGMTSRSR